MRNCDDLAKKHTNIKSWIRIMLCVALFPTALFGRTPNTLDCDASHYKGKDIGVKVNEAKVAGCDSVFIPPGRYIYSTDIYFESAGTLSCSYGVVLNYSGSGSAVKMGRDGMSSSNYDPLPYAIDGCTFSGGSSAKHGIYFNRFVVKPKVIHTTFFGFGNADAWNIFYEGQNWESRVDDLYMWSSTIKIWNGIYQNSSDPANGPRGDYGQSQLYITNSHIQNSAAGAKGVGVFLNGYSSRIINSTIAMYGGPNIHLGRWANSALLSELSMERAVGSAPCIAYGEASGLQVGTYLDGVTIRDSYCNLHNSNHLSTAHFVAPATSQSRIQNWLLERNQITDSAPGQPILIMNNLPSQMGNVANWNLLNKASASTLVHTGGEAISPWSGADGDLKTCVPE